MRALLRATLIAGLMLSVACGGGGVDPLQVPRWDPEPTEADFPAVISALRSGQPEQAVKAARARLERGAAPEGLQHYLGLALLEAGQLEQARVAFDQAIAEQPGNAEAHLFLAETLLGLGQLSAAEPHMRVAAHHLPDFAFVQFIRAQLAFHQGRSEEAQRAYLAYLQAEPTGARAAQAHAALAQLAAEAGFEDARAQHEAVATRLTQAQQFTNAYSARLRQDPDDVEALLGLAAVSISYFENRDNPLPLSAETETELLQFASATLERVLELDPDQPKALYNLGFVAIRLKRYEQALAAYDRLLTLQPDHVPAALNAAQLARGLGELGRAREIVEAIRPYALELGQRLDVHVEAALLAEAEGAADQALAEWQAAQALDPEDPRFEARIARLSAESKN